MKTTTTATNFRPFTLADAPAAVNLFNACSQALFGYDDADLTQMMNDWTTPGLNPEEVIRVLVNDENNIIGYIEVWDTTQPHVVKYVWGVIHPEHWDDACYREMLAWAEGCARARISLAPPETRVVMAQGLANQDIRRKKALEAYGFQLVRHFFRMEIDLTQPFAAPTLPEGIRVEPIDPESELRDSIVALEDGFKDHWGHVNRPIDEVYAQMQHYIKNDPDFDPSLWLLAKSDDQIAGVCRCAAKTVEDPRMGWVKQLCIRKPWRRQGLGMALLLMAFDEFRRRGAQRAGLAVDAASLTNATRLYEKAGMHVTKQYDSYEMELRPGENLTTV